MLEFDQQERSGLSTGFEMKILQAGLPKSGNLWVYETLKGARELAGIDTVPIATTLAKLVLDAGLERERGIFWHDVIDIHDDKCYAQLSRHHKFEIDQLDRYVNASSFTWSHSHVKAMSEQAYKLYDKVVYILRDPRDAAISMSHFSQSSEKTAAHVGNYASSEEYIEKSFDRFVRSWTLHVLDHIELSKSVDMYFLFYEQFSSDFDSELSSLLRYLGIELSADQLASLAKQVSFDEMKKHRPKHVRQGGSYKWFDTLEPKFVASTQRIARPLLEALGYPLDASASHALPSLPNDLTFDVAALRQSVT